MPCALPENNMKFSNKNLILNFAEFHVSLQRCLWNGESSKQKGHRLECAFIWFNRNKMIYSQFVIRNTCNNRLLLNFFFNLRMHPFVGVIVLALLSLSFCSFSLGGFFFVFSFYIHAIHTVFHRRKKNSSWNWNDSCLELNQTIHTRLHITYYNVITVEMYGIQYSCTQCSCSRRCSCLCQCVCEIETEGAFGLNSKKWGKHLQCIICNA